MQQVVTDQNIVPLFTAITALVTAIGAIINNKRNHAETMRNVARLDAHNNTVGATAIAALADSVPVTAIPALTQAVDASAPAVTPASAGASVGVTVEGG